MLSAALAQTVPVQDGDIIFQTSRSSQSEAIQLATQSPFSHVGIIVIQDGEPMVYEANGPVAFAPLKEWIRHGERKKYRIMRTIEPLSEAQKADMRVAGEGYAGIPYDLQFEWSDKRMYCSELVWKIYSGAGLRLAEPRPFSSYRLSHPEVRAKIEERWGTNVNWNELMVAPSDLAESPSLRVIEDTY